MDAGEVLHLGLGEVGRCNALKVLLVRPLFGHVVTSVLGGVIYEDEPLGIYDVEAYSVRTVRLALL